jgi:hypothetical protein
VDAPVFRDQAPPLAQRRVQFRLRSMMKWNMLF